MARSFTAAASRIATTLFVLALLALIAYFLLQLIPSAQRPTLDNRPRTTHSAETSPSR